MAAAAEANPPPSSSTITSPEDNIHMKNKDTNWYATTIDNDSGAQKILRALEEIKNIKNSDHLEMTIEKREVQSDFWWDDKLDHAEEIRIDVTFSSSSSGKTSSGATSTTEEAEVEIDDLTIGTSIAKAITENHTDDVPMMLNRSAKNHPAYPCYQVKAYGVIDPSLGKEVVGKQLAGCAQYDANQKVLFMKTTEEKLDKLSNYVRDSNKLLANNPENPQMMISSELVNANKDYYEWLITETTKTGRNDATEEL